MNPGQEKFLSFFFERVEPEHLSEAKAILESSFKEQAAGAYTREKLVKTQADLVRLVKPQYVEEVNAAMAHFASQMK